ncbi:MAG TPA: hypothetical protein VKV28_11870 [Candidatus Binataceae bacterium]|nr:hypothetical protein [Candidatus Binataceae bacterium]
MQRELYSDRLLELRNSNGRLRATIDLARGPERVEGVLKLHNLNGGGLSKPNLNECLDIYYQGGRLRIELGSHRISFWDFLGKKVLTLPTAADASLGDSGLALRLLGVSDKKNRVGVILVSDPEGLGDIAPWRLRLCMQETLDWVGPVHA